MDIVVYIKIALAILISSTISLGIIKNSVFYTSSHSVQLSVIDKMQPKKEQHKGKSVFVLKDSLVYVKKEIKPIKKDSLAISKDSIPRVLIHINAGSKYY